METKRRTSMANYLNKFWINPYETDIISSLINQGARIINNPISDCPKNLIAVTYTFGKGEKLHIISSNDFLSKFNIENHNKVTFLTLD